MNNVIMRVISLRRMNFISPPPFLLGFPGPRAGWFRRLLDVVDGGQVHHIHGIELVPVQGGLQEHEVRQVLDVDVGRRLRQQGGRLLVQVGALGVVGGGPGLEDEVIILGVVVVIMLLSSSLTHRSSRAPAVRVGASKPTTVLSKSRPM